MLFVGDVADDLCVLRQESQRAAQGGNSLMRLFVWLTFDRIAAFVTDFSWTIPSMSGKGQTTGLS
jgi:hypothetical protein